MELKMQLSLESGRLIVGDEEVEVNWFFCLYSRSSVSSFLEQKRKFGGGVKERCEGWEEKYLLQWAYNLGFLQSPLSKK
jgi:hypothetical protein